MSEELTFADILDLLFELVEKPGGGPYRNQDVVDAIGISRTAISYWRNRERSNITLENAVQLADFFGVSVEVFQCKTRAEVVAHIARTQEGKVAVGIDATVQRIIEKILHRWSGQELRLILTVLEGVVDQTAKLTELPPQPDDSDTA